MPTFAGPVTSLTVAKGRDATLKCVVDNLGDYRVAWVHVDKQTLLTIHTHVITRNKRVSVSHYNFRTWLLHLKYVEPEDSGYYMCQVNTQPMISQVGYLEIVVPPEFVNDVVNRNISVAENANISLSCRATGNPIPKIKWRREDGQPIIVGQKKVFFLFTPNENRLARTDFASENEQNTENKTPTGLDFPFVLLEEFIALIDDNACTATIKAKKDILEFVQSSKNIIDADFNDKNEKNNTAPVPTSSEMKNIRKSMHSYLDALSNFEMNNKM
ncbi:lachesin [Trichonephila clavipes]|nr:lachesin [Trichonephila clavipes]